jgi:DNA repair exonuclease SbcCD nuclease subunit
MPPAFVHAADFHLGADFRRFGTAAEKLRAAQWAALTKMLTFAASHEAAFVLICGDLFDSRFPPADVVSKAREILARFPAVPVYILPGTHDFLSDDSILARENFRADLPHVVVLDGMVKSPLVLPESGCYLHYSVNRSNRSAFSPIAGFHRQHPDGFHIGVAHGSLRIGGWNTAYDFPMSRREIENSGLDYLALGHWHRYRQEQMGKTMVVYPGTPQSLGFSDRGAGSVAYVTVGRNNQVRAEQVPTGTISFAIMADKVYHPRQVIQILEKTADPNIILKTAFTYSDNFNEPTEVAEIVMSFAPRFLLMMNQDIHEYEGGESREAAPGEAPALVSEYLAELNRLKAADSPERVGLYDKAAEVGTRLIRGDL